MIRSKIIPKRRLDHYLAEMHSDVSRAFLQKLCSDDMVLVNGKPEKSGYKLNSEDKVTMLYDMANIEKIDDIELPVLFENKDVVVINKPAGIISHSRGRYWNEPSVASFIRQDTKQAGDRAGIVHRLDRATSGVMICAKNLTAMEYLQKQFADRVVSKEYIAVVIGHLDPKHAVIDMPIERNPKAPSTFRAGPNGKPSQTEYKVLRSNDDYDEVSLLPKTGRTHQLRVHMDELKHPIVGDVLYNGEKYDRLLLHAHKLTIKIPGGESRTFIAPLPPEFQNIMAS